MENSANEFSMDTSLFPSVEREAAPPIRSRTMVKARMAVSAFYFIDGLTFGTWASLIPSFQQKFGLSVTELSFVLLGLVVGALISMPLTGRLLARHGSQRIVVRVAVAFSFALPLLTLAPNYGFLIAAAIFFGASKGALDVSINAQGLAAEDAAGKAIFSSFQGFWSLGGLSAAFLAGLAMHRGFSPTVITFVVAAMGFLLAVAARRSAIPDQPKIAAPVRASFALPEKQLLYLGALSFLALFCEGVMLDWSAVYARIVCGFTVQSAPIAFAAFALSMTGGRLSGDWIIARIGPARTMLASGLCMALGIGIAISLKTSVAMLLGFAIFGLAIANLVSIIFAAAGRVPNSRPGQALAVVITIGYLGFLIGPPTIGLLAHFAGLHGAFGIVAAFAVILALWGKRVIERPAQA